MSRRYEEAEAATRKRYARALRQMAAAVDPPAGDEVDVEAHERGVRVARESESTWQLARRALDRARRGLPPDTEGV